MQSLLNAKLKFGGWSGGSSPVVIVLEYRVRLPTTSNFNSSGIFDDLDALTTYTIEVRATNNQGNLTTNTTTITTGELPPDHPPNFNLAFSNDCITVKKFDPDNSNGVVTHYKATCNDGKTIQSNSTVVESTLEAVLCKFSPSTTVRCCVEAINSIGNSPPGNRSGFTSPIVLRGDPPVVSSSTELTVPITLHPVKLKNIPEISFYYILVGRVSSRFRRQAKASTESCDTKQALITYEEAHNQSLSCYVANKLNGSQVKDPGFPYKIGYSPTSGKYTNPPLVPRESYFFNIAVEFVIQGQPGFQLAFMNPSEIVKILPLSTAAPTTLKLIVETDSISGETNVGVIVGIIIGALALVAIGVGIFVFIRRRQRPPAKSSSSGSANEAPSNYTSLSQMSPASASEGSRPEHTAAIKLPVNSETSLSRNKLRPPSAANPPPPAASTSTDPTSDDDIYINMVVDRNWVVPAAELQSFINTSRLTIEQQFEALEALPKPVMSAALLAENKGKSRYKGLYPADGYRVRLHQESGAGRGATDYINASYIKGYKREVQYIAAQGPLQATVDDFWLMIWQEKATAIIMVTGAIERGKMKCEQYWPLNQGEATTYRDICITLTSSEVWADFTIKTLQVTKGSENRTIKHFNYLTWPDHGVPDDMGPYVTFFSKIKAATFRVTSTKVVHCSAGVGRTGTFIAMDTLMEQIGDKGMMDAFNCVRQMRVRRPCMIQTLDQYYFLYQAIAEFLGTTDYVSSPAAVDSKLADRGTSSDMIAEEFKHVAKRVKLATFDYNLAKDPDNREKNRFSEILPAKHCSLYISGNNGNYVNAVVVDTYREKDQWVVTQLPLSNTVIDFWQLMVDNKMQVVTQLEGSQVPFYPRQDGDSMVDGPFTISRTTTEQTDYVATITIQLQTTQEVKEIHVLVVKGWDNDIPSTELVMQLQIALEKSQQHTGNKRNCIMCNNGATRCGIFLCSYNAIEKLKSEQEADVYNPVLMAKHRRPQFISVLEHYEFIYRVIRDYTEAFSEYANFK